MLYEELTVVIPTYNRPEHLKRSLKYYAKVYLTAKFIVADSSYSTVAQETRKTVEDMRDELNLSYMAFEQGIEFSYKICQAVEKSTTKFTLVIGDDDFVIPSGVEACMDLLRTDSTAVAAGGIRLGITGHGPPQDDDDSWCEFWPLWSDGIVEDTALERIRRIGVPSWSQYLYSVYRTDTLNRALSMVSDRKYSSIVEYMIYAAVLAEGKWPQIDGLFALCSHDSPYYAVRDRASFPHYWGNVGGRISQLTLPSTSADVKYFSEAIGGKIADHEGIPTEKATQNILRIFWAANIKHLVDSNIERELVDGQGRIMSAAFSLAYLPRRLWWSIAWCYGSIRQAPQVFSVIARGLVNGSLWRVISNPGREGRLRTVLLLAKRARTFDAARSIVLRPGSPWHNSFMPAFEAWRDDPYPAVSAEPT